MKFLKIIWQFPQVIFGLILIKIWQCTKYCYAGEYIWFTTCAPKMFTGVSLGPIIIFNADKYFVTDAVFPVVFRHEKYGHTVQSLIFGPLYLLTVGVVSLSRNLLARLHVNSRLYRFFLITTVLWRVKDVALSVNYWLAQYYKHWPENQADKFAKITR